MTRLFISLFIFLALAPGSVLADRDDVATAANALKAGRYGEAVQLAKPLSDAGNPDAQLLMGILYFGGLGVAKSPNKAFELYTKAAEQGQAAAMHNLATMYYRGEGTNINFGLSRDWNRKAAENGLVVAQHDYASMLRSGVGGPPDRQQARFWFKKAADAGYANAAYKLGLMLRSGPGSNAQASVAYLCKAAYGNHPEARQALGSNIQHCRR